MARKKKVAEPIMYTARSRRSEPGIGVVEKGASVPLGEHLDPATIAHLIKAGYYSPDEITPAVQAELDKLKDG